MTKLMNLMHTGRATRMAMMIAVMGVSLSGCALLSNPVSDVWGHTKSAANWVVSPVVKLLRGTPEQDYQFAEAETTTATHSEWTPVDIFLAESTTYTDTTTSAYSADLRPAPVQNYDMASPYAGAQVELFAENTVSFAPQTVTEDPRTVSFVNLNGETELSDWRYCEVTNQGYLEADETGFRVNAGFEVCMRNKGYVRESEIAHYGPVQSISADDANIENIIARQNIQSSSYSYP